MQTSGIPRTVEPCDCIFFFTTCQLAARAKGDTGSTSTLTSNVSSSGAVYSSSSSNGSSLNCASRPASPAAMLPVCSTLLVPSSIAIKFALLPGFALRINLNSSFSVFFQVHREKEGTQLCESTKSTESCCLVTTPQRLQTLEKPHWKTIGPCATPGPLQGANSAGSKCLHINYHDQQAQQN